MRPTQRPLIPTALLNTHLHRAHNPLLRLRRLRILLSHVRETHARIGVRRSALVRLARPQRRRGARSVDGARTGVSGSALRPVPRPVEQWSKRGDAGGHDHDVLLDPGVLVGLLGRGGGGGLQSP